MTPASTSIEEQDIGTSGTVGTDAECRPETLKGPMEILCDEIAYPYGPTLERAHLFVGFVASLVDEVSDMMAWRSAISRGHSESGYEVAPAMRPLKAVREMLALDPLMVPERDRQCAELHMLMDQPDDGPCNRFLEMLSSCVSAIRFGLETPCRSRHAAEASNHIWNHRYGVRLWDEHTTVWQKDWARKKLDKVISALQVGTSGEAAQCAEAQPIDAQKGE